MFIAMNRFRVAPGKEEAFEQVWKNRQTYLDELPGFVSFYLLKGPKHEDHSLYTSHTIWQSYEHFEAWTRSEAFRKAHANAGQNRDLYVGGPQFEGFEVVHEVLPRGGQG